MDWGMAIERYNNAFKVFNEWYNKRMEINENFIDYYNQNETLPCYDRCLYDFFDEKKLIIIVEYYGEFSYEIECEDINYNDRFVFRNRTDLEEVAFLKAFELLEKNLEKLKNVS